VFSLSGPRCHQVSDKKREVNVVEPICLLFKNRLALMQSLKSKFLLVFLMVLVPAYSVFPIPTQAQQDDSPSLQVSNGGLHDLPLKAIQDSDGEIDTQEDFEIQPNDIITVGQSADFHVLPNGGTVEAVKITDNGLQTTDLVFSTSTGRVSQSLAPKAYLLDVIVKMDNDDRYLYETVIAVLAPGQTLQQVNTQNIFQNFVTTTTRSDTHTTVVFRDDDDDEEEPSICFFDPNDEECDPDENGDCPEGFGRNEDGRCIPSQRCPDGFHRANDDESGRCIDEDELRECENNGGWVEEGEFCPEDELPFCNEDHSNEPCISGQEETEPTTCEEGFILENDVCTETSSNCGGEPCTPSQKEDSWTSSVPESSPGVPIEPEPESTDSEETVEEIEEEEDESDEENKENGDD
jgi:hypothetical protein